MAVQRPGALRSGETTTCEEGAEAPRGTPYDTDFALWATKQAHFLKQRRATALDWDNLAEEVEALAKSDKRTIGSHLENALLHALKLAYWETERKGNENLWREHLINACGGIAKVIEDSPSLRNYPAEVFAPAYAASRRRAALLTGHRDLPDVCPWTLEQVLDESFMPEPAKPVS